MSKKETRIMKVTLDEEEFQKYDQGLVRFNKGSRRAKDGKLSALPDITPLDPSEDKRAEIALKEIELETQKQKNMEHEMRLERAEVVLAAFQYITDKLGELGVYLNEHPEAREKISQFGQRVRDVVVSTRTKMLFRIKRIPKAIKHDPLLIREKSASFKVEIIDEHQDRVTISEEQAEQLFTKMRETAEELAAMISLWSMISIKDEKNEMEYALEQRFVTNLLTGGMRKTVETLVSNRHLLDDGTAQTLSDFLDGFLTCDGRQIPIPIMLEENGDNE